MATRGPERTYLVTGASSGIGLSIVRLLVDRGHRVITSGRRQQTELPTDFPDVDYLPADLGTQAGLARLVERLPARLDRAILAAGIGHYRPLIAENVADVKRTIDLNLTANIFLAHALHAPLAAAEGRLGLIGSVAHRGASTMPVYAASKAALDGFARSLSIEWSGRIVVKVLHPGPTATGMAARAGRPVDVLDRLMLPVPHVAGGIVDALESGGYFRHVVSFASVLKRSVTSRTAA